MLKSYGASLPSHRRPYLYEVQRGITFLVVAANQVNVIVLPSTELGHGDPAFLFLHYFGGSAREWTEVVDLLSPRHRCICADMPGFGQAMSLSGFTVEEMVNQVTDLVRTKALSRFILVGHSMTGKVALAFATRSPASLLGLVLVTPSPPGPEPIEDEAREEMLSHHGTLSGAERLIDKITARRLPPDLYERAVQDNLLASPEAWSAWLKHGSYEDLSDRIDIGNLPVLIITGQDDPALPASVQTRQTIPYLQNTSIVDLPECGHLPPLEAAPMLASLLDEFSRTHVTPQAA